MYERIKKETMRKPIEAIGVLVVVIYTAFAGYQSCQMRKANRLTQQIVRSTVSASLACAVSSSFSRGAAGTPLTGAFYVTCNNVGRVAAEKVSGSFTLTAKSFPDEQVLYTESWVFGGRETFILGNDGNAWPFYSSNFSPERERQSITDGKEIVIGDVSISYSDETGETIRRKSCQVEMNWSVLGGSPDSWAECKNVAAVQGILRASQKKTGRQRSDEAPAATR
jgi:hypothetical protein